MNILVRCDSSITIGTGHVIRCLNLANTLKKHSVNVVFGCQDLDGNIISLIEEKQFKVIKLQSPIASETAEITRIIKDEKISFVIVDHYQLGLDWEKSVRQTGVKLLVVDDLFREHNCDAFLDQNYHQNHEQKVTGKVPGEALLFLGPKFALLSASFAQVNKSQRQFSSIRRVLIFFGGIDHVGETWRLLPHITAAATDVHFDVVVGKQNPKLEEIKNFVKNKDNISLHIQTNKMSELMSKIDLFIGSGGSVTWERSYLGVPAICVAIADNQIEIAQSLHASEVHQYLGFYQDLNPAAYSAAFEQLNLQPELRKKYCENSLNLGVSSRLSDVVHYIIKPS